MDRGLKVELKVVTLWWDSLLTLGPKYGYFPNASKTYLVVKDDMLETAATIFNSTGVSVTSRGRPVLGSPIGSPEYVHQFVSERVKEWVHQVEVLSSVAVPHPQSAFAAYTHGLCNKWTYLCRTCPDISHLFQPLEDTIRLQFIPALTGRDPPNDQMRDLLSLPSRHGGLGLVSPCVHSASQHEASLAITSPLVSSVLGESDESACDVQCAQQEIISDVKKRRSAEIRDKAKGIHASLPLDLQKLMVYASEKGASIWLSVLPLQDQNLHLHKSSFRDALCLRYGWEPPRLPSMCVCGSPFTVQHCLSCNVGGYPIMRHNDLRDHTAALMSTVCSDITTEPQLQPLSGEQLSLLSANSDGNARLDVAATNFWSSNNQRSFFDIRVFNPLASSNRASSANSVYQKHEREKRRGYEQRVREIENGCFSPLVFNTLGGMGPTAQVVYKHLADLIADKLHKPYSTIIRLVRCRLCFSLLRSTITCLRGSRRPKTNFSSLFTTDPALVVAEGRVPH